MSIVVRPVCIIRCAISFDILLGHYKLKTNTYYNPHPIDPRVHDPPHLHVYDTIIYVFIVVVAYIRIHWTLAYCVESSLSSSTAYCMSIWYILYWPVYARRCRSSTRRRAADSDEAYIQRSLRAFQWFFAVAAQFNSAIFTLGQSHSKSGSARALQKLYFSIYNTNHRVRCIIIFFLVSFVLCFISKKSPKDIRSLQM